MSARVTILCGPARSGKTRQLLRGYRESLRRRAPGASLWLAPNWRVAAEVRAHLFDGTLAGCFAPGVMTFAQYADSVLRAGRVALRPVNRLMKRELIRQMIAAQAAAGRLRYFQSIANTPGLVDLICEFIGELKRLEIWPDEFRRACERRGGLADKDRELVEIYGLYQQALQEHGLFDAEGRFWSARDLLRREDKQAATARPAVTCPLLLFPQYLVADGFTDFTRTQHEILDVLAARSEATFISLPLEAEPRRADLFAKPLATLERLRGLHAETVVEPLSRPTVAGWPDMAVLERGLFENPRKKERGERSEGEADLGRVSQPGAPCAQRGPGIEILAAARQIGEIEMIAARVKRLLVTEEARPGEIAVVFRSVEHPAELVRSVFGRFGIPVALESGQSLDRSPALRALAALLQLDLDDWPFDRVLAVLGSNYFEPNWPEWLATSGAVVERTIRQLQAPRGRQRLIEELAESKEECSAESRRATRAVVQRLAAAFDALPQRATLPDWAEAWTALAEETGLLAAIDGLEPSDRISFDRRAWARLVATLSDGDRLAGWLRQRPPELDRRGAFDALMDILASDRIGQGGDESGNVRVLGADSIRSLRIPYLFLAGLSEKVFPPPDREDRLYSETESARLIEAGLPLAARTERTCEEMLLFYEAVTRATKRLWLSYPALDEKAQPLLPSPFLGEVEQALGPDRIGRVEQTDLSPIPRHAEPLCEADFRVQAVATATEGNVSLLAGLFARGEGTEGRSERTAAPLAAGLELLHQRQDRQQFGPAEGILPSDLAIAYATKQFGSEHTFAATELEQYASCPFRFFIERVLRIEPLDDLTLEFDALARGRVLHDVLKTFHESVNDRLGRPASPLKLDAAEYDAMLHAAIDQSLPPEPTKSLRAAMREIDRRLVTEWLSRYREQLEAYDAQWTELDSPLVPELFEVSFGRKGQPAPSTDRPFEIPLLDAASDDVGRVANPNAVRIAGRIDRIDSGMVAGRHVFSIVDYKTGGPIALTPETVAAGVVLQLPLYALAAMELLLADRDPLPWRAGYWYIRQGGFSPRKALRMYSQIDGRIELEADWEEIRDALADTVMGLAGNLRAARFPVCSADDRCTGYCPFSTICRINQVRSLEKKCQPAASV
ncbi:MAG: PD-(D/E)XK nuclease family protein [Thermoguttaceae bacterium]